MSHQNIVALFHTRDDAEAAQRELESIGIPATDIRVGARREAQPDDVTGDQSPGQPMTPRAEDIREDEGGLFDWLFGGAEGVPEAHRRTYRRSIYQQGNVALSVRAIHSDPEYHRICDLLERHDPLDVEESGSVHSASLEGAGAQVASPTAKAMEPPTDYKPPAGRRRRARAYPIRSQ